MLSKQESLNKINLRQKTSLDADIALNQFRYDKKKHHKSEFKQPYENFITPFENSDDNLNFDFNHQNLHGSISDLVMVDKITGVNKCTE